MTSQRETSQANGKSQRKLYRIGALTASIYLVILLFYLRGPQVHSHTARELFAWFCVLSLLPLFWQGYQAVKHLLNPRPARAVLGFAAIFCFLTFFTTPFHSTDVFGYINRGWQQVHYNQNPYIDRVGDIPQWEEDPMLTAHWIYNPDPYGFLFTLLARFLCQLGSGNLWLTLALFKAVNVLAYALTGWLVWSGAKLLGHANPNGALYLFLWNPLVLVHHIANGHNDILVGCMIALSIYLAIKGAYVWIIPVLVAGTLLKYGPVLLIPLALIFIVRKKGWRAAVLGCLLGAALALLVSSPYLQNWESLKIAEIRENADLIDNSLHSFLIHVFGTIAAVIPSLAEFRATVNAVIKTALRGGFLVSFVIVVFMMLKNASVNLLIEKSVLVMFLLICVTSSKFNAWYLAMLLPPALFLSEEHWLRRLVVLITCTELLSITFFKQAYMLNYFAMILVPTWIIFMEYRKKLVLAGSADEESLATHARYLRTRAE
jgi:hypothetical protein